MFFLAGVWSILKHTRTSVVWSAWSQFHLEFLAWVVDDSWFMVVLQVSVEFQRPGQVKSHRLCAAPGWGGRMASLVVMATCNSDGFVGFFGRSPYKKRNYWPPSVSLVPDIICDEVNTQKISEHIPSPIEVYDIIETKFSTVFWHAFGQVKTAHSRDAQVCHSLQCPWCVADHLSLRRGEDAAHWDGTLEASRSRFKKTSPQSRFHFFDLFFVWSSLPDSLAICISICICIYIYIHIYE